MGKKNVSIKVCGSVNDQGFWVCDSVEVDKEINPELVAILLDQAISEVKGEPYVGDAYFDGKVRGGGEV